MPFIPTLAEPVQSRLETNSFPGYDHRLRIPDGAFHDTENLSTDHYPMLANRPARGVVCEVGEPGGIICKDKIIWTGDNRVYIDGHPIDVELNNTRPKQLVSMGAYLLIFPDKKYVNTAKPTDFGDIEATWRGMNLTYTLCDPDGAAYENLTVQAKAPEHPDNGDYWIDTKKRILCQYGETAGMWVEVPTVCTKITASGIGENFAKYDGVTISGCAGSAQLRKLNGTKLIHSRGENFIVVTGLIDSTATQDSGDVTVTRAVPNLDYVCEAGNRLWGCRYGMVNGKPVNELYASKLGDFRNWNCFQGISTDSWAASVGSDGAWTAAVNYLGCPTFFKENRIHRVYPAADGGHQVVETVCTGVEAGSWRSACVAGERLYYKGIGGVYAYDGSLPVKISDALGDVRYRKAIAGAVGAKYYISMLDPKGNAHLFTFDTEKGLWCREDDLRPVMFAERDGDLWCVTADHLMTMLGSEGEKEETLHWMAETGIQHYADPGRKYLGRCGFRLKLWPGSTVRLSIQYDSDGVWHDMGSFAGDTLCTRTIPVIPRRCDHLQYRLEGTGQFRLFQFTRVYEEGSDLGC